MSRSPRRTLVAVVAVLLLLGGPMPASVGAPRAAPVLDRPNIVLFLTDDQTMYSLATMPYLSSKPYGNWVEFSHAYASTPICCPARATILTGRYSYKVDVPANAGAGFDDTNALPVWLQAAGYRTSLIGKYLNGYPWNRGPTWIPAGWDDWRVSPGDEEDPAQRWYYDYDLNVNGTIVSYGTAPEDYETDVLTAHGLDFLSSTPVEQPFYLELSYAAPHRQIVPAPRHENVAFPPVDLPASFNEADVSDKPAWVQALPLVDEAFEQDEYLRERQAMLAVDESIQAILEAIDSRGQLDDTVVVFMTDNGYARGEHRHDKKACVYDPCIQTPMLVRYPGATQRTVDELVSNIDVTPTFLDLAGGSASIPQDGTSLVPLIEGTATSWRDEILLSYRPTRTPWPAFWAVRTNEFTYAELQTGEKELYDLVNDPDQMVNLAGGPRYARVQKYLAKRLVRLRKAADNAS